MENPDAYRVGKELNEFRWQQTHTNSNRCFTMHFYLENDLPVLTGRFLSPDGGETVCSSSVRCWWTTILSCPALSRPSGKTLFCNL